ncbi:MAG: MOSC domain-containing protein [Deltaproteobacteria bacterium]|nr:MOSC domain-containing protein [Deltaproteobacteria bacterium]
MQLLSVNVSLPREIESNRKMVTTSIFKEPVNGRVRLRSMSLQGDGQADLKGHGGVNRAVYVYTMENYDFWKKELQRDDFFFGQFGENFTVDGMLEDQIHVGDVFRVGGALIQVTQPRIPCFKLGIRMNMARFPKLFLASGRVGFYIRVLEEGEVGAGDLIHRVRTDPNRMTVREINNLLYFDATNIEDARRALAIDALSAGWRESFKERLLNAGVGFDVNHKSHEAAAFIHGG